MGNIKPTCFVIQDFDDGGTFDKRYEETIEPALKGSEVIPLRADKILGLQPVIQKIEEAIRKASICVAEVTTDNPNVWLELGYALAIDKPVVLLCDMQTRSKLPFDIQHRPVIFYRGDSRSGYEELERKIKENVKNELKRDESISSTPSIKRSSDEVKNLEDYELDVLTILFELWPDSPDGTSHRELAKKFKVKSWHNETVLALGISKLLDKQVIQQNTNPRQYEGKYFLYSITAKGRDWLTIRENDILKNDIPF